jgi:hypothetical protein
LAAGLFVRDHVGVLALVAGNYGMSEVYESCIGVVLTECSRRPPRSALIRKTWSLCGLVWLVVDVIKRDSRFARFVEIAKSAESDSPRCCNGRLCI